MQDKPCPEGELDPKDEPAPKGRKRGAAGRNVAQAQAEDEEDVKPAAKKVRTARAGPAEEEEVQEEAPRKVAATKVKRKNRAGEENGEGDAAKTRKELEEVCIRVVSFESYILHIDFAYAATCSFYLFYYVGETGS